MVERFLVARDVVVLDGACIRDVAEAFTVVRNLLAMPFLESTIGVHDSFASCVGTSRMLARGRTFVGRPGGRAESQAKGEQLHQSESSFESEAFATNNNNNVV